mgnify:FL=1|jgi:hypothetical protein
MQSLKITLVVAGLAAALAWALKPDRPSQPTTIPLINVQEIGELASLRINYSDVIEFNERLTQDIPWTQWELRFGGTKVLLVAKGECLIGTNLQLAKYHTTSEKERTATLKLPLPRVISARLNHDAKNNGSYFYTVDSKGVSALIPGNDNQTKAMNRALQKGQSAIESSCLRAEYSLAARKSAEAVLTATYVATGWKVNFIWQ